MNAHSHAFQYAMAGVAEYLPREAGRDDFWSWREKMYALAMSVEPDAMEAIAGMLYGEMARHGYTAVAEFHYLHHAPDGRPYADQAEMGRRLIAAAKSAGIKITLIPIFYRMGGFGQAPQARQIRFLSPTVEAYQRLLEVSAEAVKGEAHARLGWGIHSLRAATTEDFSSLLGDAPAALPFHLHIAEQRKEVEACEAYLGARPIRWLLENHRVDGRFHLVHATHCDPDEARDLAKSGAHVVLCPSTEGNLGDGFFPLRAYLEAGGRWSIGTDSHVGLSFCEEIRWLDYGQRLRHEKRGIFCLEAGDDSGELALRQAILGGRAAMGFEEMPFALGQPFDAVVYDAHHPLLAMAPQARRLSSLVYASDTSAILGTITDGRWIVRQQRHHALDTLRQRFLSVL
jgi:formimidoylglutamate deiminase